ncbi:MAG: hypothetical protein K2W91_13665 [Novosphingobium sp.]|nr:hypothetical protein [Novosphingobium sp.]
MPKSLPLMFLAVAASGAASAEPKGEWNGFDCNAPYVAECGPTTCQYSSKSGTLYLNLKTKRVRFCGLYLTKDGEICVIGPVRIARDKDALVAIGNDNRLFLRIDNALNFAVISHDIDGAYTASGKCVSAPARIEINPIQKK